MPEIPSEIRPMGDELSACLHSPLYFKKPIYAQAQERGGSLVALGGKLQHTAELCCVGAFREHPL